MALRTSALADFPKLRVRYVRQTYVPQLKDARLTTLILDGSRDVAIPYAWRVREKSPFQERAIRNHLKAPGEGGYVETLVLERALLTSVAKILLAEFFSGQAVPEATAAIKLGQLVDFFADGRNNPILIFRDQRTTALELTTQGLERVGDPRAFLRGAAPTFWLADRIAIERECENRIVEAIVDDGARLVVVTGAAGDGKTTALMRASLKLADRGWKVFFASNPPVGGAAPRAPAMPDDICYVIDRADLATSYAAVEKQLAESPSLRVILCARDFEWRQRRVSFNLVHPTLVEVARVNELEARALAEHIVSHKAAKGNETAAFLQGRILASSRNAKHPHLFAAMLTATQGKGFEGIIDDIFASFERRGLDWLLRSVACGTALFDISNREAGLLNHSTLLQLALEHRSNDSVAAKQVLRDARSELVSIRLDRRSTVYELRHPDISRRILEQQYGIGNSAEIDLPHALIDDLARVMTATVLAIQGRPSGNGEGLGHARKIAHLWFSARHRYGTAAIEVARELSDHFVSVLGSSEEERRQRIVTWLERAEHEAKFARYDQTLESGVSGDDITRVRALYGKATDEGVGMANAWLQWASFERRIGNSGFEDPPPPGSSRSILRQAWSHEGNRFSTLLVELCAHEFAANNLGDLDGPAPYTARELLRGGWDAIVRHNTDLIVRWARLEVRSGNLGEFDEPRQYSARWLMREAWSDPLHQVSSLGMLWATVEASQEPPTSPLTLEKYRARWIFNESWNLRRSTAIAIAWARTEMERGNIGDFESPEPYSARWIFRSAWSDTGSRNPELAIEWVKAEQVLAGEAVTGVPVEAAGEADLKAYTVPWIVQQAWSDQASRTSHLAVYLAVLARSRGNMGDWDNPAPGSARWIFREINKTEPISGGVALAWASLERDDGKIGSITEQYTARWILHQAHANDSLQIAIVKMWAAMEYANNNAGNTVDPEEWSARWLLRQWIWLSEVADSFALAASFEALNGNLGELSAPEPWTARDLFRRAWRRIDFEERNAKHWAKIERTVGEMTGDNSIEFGPLWIFNAAKKRFRIQATSLDQWVKDVVIGSITTYSEIPDTDDDAAIVKF